VNLQHARAPAFQQTLEPARAIAPHGVDHHGQAGIADWLQVDQTVVFQVADVSRRGVEQHNAAVFDRVRGVDALHTGHAVGDEPLDLFQALRIDGAAIFVAHFEAIIRRWVV